MTIKLDLRHVVGLLVVVILVMLAVWQPWKGISDRTISVMGEATVKASPDEFIFSPIYEKKAATTEEAISAVSELGNGVVARLKELGVAEEAIKNNVSTSRGYEPLTGKATDELSAQYSLTVTVNDETLAKTVLAYIATTPTLYGVSPQSTFTKETRKSLETEARGLALADARTKASQTADELDVRVGSVVSVSEPNWGGPIFLEGRTAPAVDTAESKLVTPELLIGQQEVTYTVTVAYRLR